MKILLDATPLALTGFLKGGMFRYCLELARHLPAVLPPEGGLKLYFNFFQARHKARMEEVLRGLGNPDSVLSRLHPRLLELLHAPVEWTAGPHDLFHGPFDRLRPTRRSARVVTIHDLAFLRAPEGLPPAMVAELGRVVPRAVKAAHRILTVSEYSRADLIERLGVDPERVEAIPHGVGPEYRPPSDPEADGARLRGRYGIQPGHLLYLGTLQPNKNLERLCQAFQKLRRRGFSGQLVLAGARGWLFDAMWARIAARGDDQGVLLPGFVKEEDIPRLYGSARAFVLVSLLEGFGIPLLEAMACGAPVVAARACSLPEVAGGAAVLVDPLDPESTAAGIETALDPGGRPARIEAGLRRAAGFRWEETARRHLAAYRRARETAA